jgi:dihydroorotate dehydrogenase electron transfer subunit
VTTSLTTARDELGRVTRLEELGGGMLELTAALPHIAATAQPGQFAQLRCGIGISPLLRRPFSVAWTAGDLASFVFAPVGAGTGVLAALRPGDPLQALGPLGTGFSLDTGAPRALCVSGGLGCAPFPMLVRALRDRGVADVAVVSGAATAALLYPAERFRRGDGGVTVTELTVDGSRGLRGLVTDAVPQRCGRDTAVFACGPNPMMAALYRTLAGGVPAHRAEASLEAPMGCGYGTCLGCAVPRMRHGDQPPWALCCRDGPVMSMDSIDWDALALLPPAHVA